MLRQHAYMQNWLGDVAESVRAEGLIYSPIGDGRVPFIDTRDIAAVAAEVLLHPEVHVGKKYVLTGGTAVGFADLAGVLSEATGRKITYRPISMEEARARWRPGAWLGRPSMRCLRSRPTRGMADRRPRSRRPSSACSVARHARFAISHATTPRRFDRVRSIAVSARPRARGSRPRTGAVA